MKVAHVKNVPNQRSHLQSTFKRDRSGRESEAGRWEHPTPGGHVDDRPGSDERRKLDFDRLLSREKTPLAEDKFFVRRFQICVVGENAEVLEERRIQTDRERFAAVLGKRPKARVLIEASTESEWVARWLEELGHEVIVADTTARWEGP